MDFEQFWGKFWSEDIFSLYDETIEIFSQPLSEEILDTYEVGEVLTEFSGHYIDARRFEEMDVLLQLLRAHHPELCDECEQYFSIDLIRYYQHKGMRERLEKEWKAMSSGNYDLGFLMESFRYLSYFGKYEKEVLEMVDREYEQIKNNPKWLYGAEDELAEAKAYFLLERAFENTPEGKSLPWAELLKELEVVDFVFEERFIEAMQNGLWGNVEHLPPKITRNEKGNLELFNTLEFYFLKYLKEQRGCSFYTGFQIFSRTISYLLDEDRKRSLSNNVFSFDLKTWANFVEREGGIFGYKCDEQPLLIYGGLHFLDFLKANGWLNEKEFIRAIKPFYKMHESWKKSNKSILWQYAYVIDWGPAESFTEEEWAEEQQAFKDSYDLPKEANEYTRLDGSDPNEAFAHLFKDGIKSSNSETNKKKNLPVKSKSKKIGRNEKVSVRYPDGKVLKNVKYKRVIHDVENGNCELI